MENYLITGASSEIGRALINYLSQKENTKVLCFSRRKVSFDKPLIKKHLVYHHGLNFLVDKDNEFVAEQAAIFFDKPFNLIHCVGNFWYHDPFLDIDMQGAKEMMDSQYTTLYGIIHKLLPLMIRLNGGRILAFSCNSVRYHYPNMAPFTASKAAIESLLKCVAHEFSKYNIVANALALSSVQTKTVQDSKPFGDFEHYIPLDNLCKVIEATINIPSSIVNGNIINCFEHSNSFYEQGYFHRIKN